MTMSGSPPGDEEGERTPSGLARTMHYSAHRGTGSGRHWPRQSEVYEQIPGGRLEPPPNDLGADLCTPHGSTVSPRAPIAIPCGHTMKPRGPIARTPSHGQGLQRLV